MKVFYTCYGSAHSSVIAAFIHVGILDKNVVPPYKKITFLPHYDRTDDEEIGTPFFIGFDEWGNEIYVIGAKSNKNLLKNFLKDFIHYNGIKEDFIFVDTLQAIGIFARIGGFISRRLGLTFIGRPLTVFDIRRNYWRFVSLVENVKNSIKVPF